MEFVQPIRDKKQIDAMKKVLKVGSVRNYALFTLGINSGLRISDLLKLTVADVLDDRGKVKDRISLREKKTGKSKDFPLGKTAKKALAEHLLTWAHKPEGYLFRSKKGGALTRQQAYNIINAAARAVGIREKIGTHTLRKTFGYHAYQNGTDITVIQKLLNHSAPSVTLAYIGITRDQLDDVYLTLEL
ncbi:MAG: site-specific integrase [Desulfotomaculaceae bacterium]|nr:site-specific integrase [Desulfotomaculaceae bacterium]